MLQMHNTATASYSLRVPRQLDNNTSSSQSALHIMQKLHKAGEKSHVMSAVSGPKFSKFWAYVRNLCSLKVLFLSSYSSFHSEAICIICNVIVKVKTKICSCYPYIVGGREPINSGHTVHQIRLTS